MTYEDAIRELNELRKIPYPEPKNVMKDHKFADRLQNDFSGSCSEVTAVMQYVYQHIAITEYKTISKIMLAVAEVEMRHLDIIGEIINMMGKKPYYIENKFGKAWTASNVYYGIKDLSKTMKENIAGEERAIEAYSKDKELTSNPSLKAIFDRIIMDERSHIKIFNGILKDLETNKKRIKE